MEGFVCRVEDLWQVESTVRCFTSELYSIWHNIFSLSVFG